MSLNGLMPKNAAQNAQFIAKKQQAFEVLLADCLSIQDLTAVFGFIDKHRPYPKLAASFLQIMLSKCSAADLILYLKNSKFQAFLIFPDLMLILQYAQYQKQKARSAQEILMWDEVVLTLAQNPDWCKTIGYHTFVMCAASNALVANYIANTIEFLTHLGPYYLHQFLSFVPQYSYSFLMVLNKEYRNNPSRHYWIEATLKEVIKIPAVQQVLLNDRLFTELYLLLESAFHKDKRFAAWVLRQPYLVQHGLKASIHMPFKHPLLTQSDYIALSNDYAGSNPMLSRGYSMLAFGLDGIVAPCPEKAIEKENKEDEESALVAHLERLAGQLETLSVKDEVSAQPPKEPNAPVIVHAMKRSTRCLSLDELNPIKFEENDKTSVSAPILD